MATETDINDVCDYVVVRLSEAGGGLNALKLQKLMYYVQAWSLAFYDQPLFPGKFQAWIHGPVNRQLYDRFNSTKSLYSEITRKDVRPSFNASGISEASISHIQSVLDVYAGYSGSQLEDMTHQEEPWVKARGGLDPSARCESEIDEGLMKRYYKQRIVVEGNDGQ